MSEIADNRRARGATTKNALMRAAEQLIAERGMENTSIREIVAAANQKNESALQYHFKNLSGLLDAIRDERSLQVQALRAEALAELPDNVTPDLRTLCSLMVTPTFELARNNPEFRNYIKAFGHQAALSGPSPLRTVSQKGAGGESGARLGTLLREALPHLSNDAFRRRMEAAVMLCSAQMYHEARNRNAFRGKHADLTLNSLIDALVGLLDAPVSEETQKFIT